MDVHMEVEVNKEEYELHVGSNAVRFYEKMPQICLTIE